MTDWPAATEPVELYRDDDQVLVAWNNVLIERCRGRATVDSQSRALRWTQTCHQTWPGQAAHLLLVPTRAQVPEGGVRKAALETLRTYGTLPVAGFVVELEGSGFWVAAARGASSGMLLAARVRFPVLISGSRAESTAWLAERAGGAGDWTADALQAICDHPPLA